MCCPCERGHKALQQQTVRDPKYNNNKNNNNNKKTIWERPNRPYVGETRDRYIVVVVFAIVFGVALGTSIFGHTHVVCLLKEGVFAQPCLRSATLCAMDVSEVAQVWWTLCCS